MNVTRKVCKIKMVNTILYITKVRCNIYSHRYTTLGFDFISYMEIISLTQMEFHSQRQIQVQAKDINRYIPRVIRK